MKVSRVKFKSDKYKKSRGGYSRLLDISCEKCSTHLFYYQKDGPGILKRVYSDRILDSAKYGNLPIGQLKSTPQMKCPNCQEHIGTPINYKKESRLAFRLFQGSVIKKITKSR